MTGPAPKGDNRLRSENARKWLAAGSLDRDSDDIAATVDRLVSALDSRDWMTSPNSPSKPARAATRPTDPAGARPSDDLSFAEGADFREVARRIAEFRQARPDPATGSRPAPASEAARPQARPVPQPNAAPPRTTDRGQSKWDADWRDFSVDSAPADAEAPSDAFDGDETAAPLRTRPMTHDDWPKAPAARETAEAAQPAEAPASGTASLRQRLAALRARSMAEAVPAETPAEAPAPARKPLDSSDAFAKAMLAQFENGDWLTDDETDTPDASAYGPDIELAEVAPDPEPVSIDEIEVEEEIETWAADDAAARDVSNESLLAALDAHLAAEDPFEADTATPADASDTSDATDATLAAPADEDALRARMEAEADRRLAVDAANRAEELATATGRRIDALVDRLGRLEDQDLPSRFATLAERFDRIDGRLADIAAQAPQADLGPVTAPMEAIEARIARLEATTADQYASLCAMISTVAHRVAGGADTNKRLAAIEHHIQELARRVETHEGNLRAMTALTGALDRLEARLGAPRPQAPAVSVPTAPRHPAADAVPRPAVHAVPSAPRGPVAPDQQPSQGHAMSEREAILERYRRQSRHRGENQG
ncbi:hypothetical protein [Amorphus suaedae]